MTNNGAFLIPPVPGRGTEASKKTIACAGKLPVFSSSKVVVSKQTFAAADSEARVNTLLQRQPMDTSGFGGAPAAGKGEKMIVWFRGDLRLHDHPALKYAEEHGSGVIPLYTFDPRQFGKTSFGFAKTGRYRAEFLIEAVEQLRERLRKIGSDLIVRQGKPEDVIMELCRQTGVKKVVYHREVCFEEQEVEQSLRKVLEENRIEHKAMWSNTLYDIDDLPFNVENMPDVYAQFRDMVQKAGKIRDPKEAPKSLPSLIKCEPGRMPTLRDLGLDSQPSKAVKSEKFTGGEMDAMDRLDKYITDARKCETAGNVSAHLGADFSCKISPWLALGCVSPRRIHQQLRKQKVVPEISKSTTYFELVWRDFFRFITLKYGASRLHSKSGLSAKGSSKAGAMSGAAVKQQMMSGAQVKQQMMSNVAVQQPVLSGAAH